MSCKKALYKVKGKRRTVSRALLAVNAVSTATACLRAPKIKVLHTFHRGLCKRAEGSEMPAQKRSRAGRGCGRTAVAAERSAGVVRRQSPGWRLWVRWGGSHCKACAWGCVRGGVCVVATVQAHASRGKLTISKACGAPE